MVNHQQSKLLRKSELIESVEISPSEVASALYLLVSAVIGFVIISMLTAQAIIVALGTLVFAVLGMWLLAILSRLRLIVRSLKHYHSYKTGDSGRVKGDA